VVRRNSAVAKTTEKGTYPLDYDSGTHAESNYRLKTVFQRRFKRLKPVGNLIHLFQVPLTKYILVTRGCLLDLVSRKTLSMTLGLLGIKIQKL